MMHAIADRIGPKGQPATGWRCRNCGKEDSSALALLGGDDCSVAMTQEAALVAILEGIVLEGAKLVSP
jgi:hypothetical protein